MMKPDMPVWLLVFERIRDGWNIQYGVAHILKAIPTNLNDLDQVWSREVNQLVNNQEGRYIEFMYLAREPENPLRQFAEAQAQESQEEEPNP